MKSKTVVVFGICLLTFLGFSLIAPVFSYAESKENDVGIRFTEGSTDNTEQSSDDSKKEPAVIKPTTKPGGRLPSTGELMQPVILLLVGWLVVIIGTAIFLSSQKANSEEG
ncbi:hypothetical protein ACYSNW_09615 [Enterococcus sp. LJL99]